MVNEMNGVEIVAKALSMDEIGEQLRDHDLVMRWRYYNGIHNVTLQCRNDFDAVFTGRHSNPTEAYIQAFSQFVGRYHSNETSPSKSGSIQP